MSAPDTLAERLGELLAKATPGLWWVAGKGTIRRGEMDWIAKANWQNKEANTALIVAAINALPTLLAERKTMREALGWYETKVSSCNQLHSEGDDARDALARDRGELARQALKGQTDGE